MLMVLSSLRLQLYLGLLLLRRDLSGIVNLGRTCYKTEERLTVKRGLAASVPRGRTNTEGLKITEK